MPTSPRTPCVTGHCLVQVTDFQLVASEFLQRLKTTGPGLPNTDLAKGLELLKKFQVHAAAFLLWNTLLSHATYCLCHLCVAWSHEQVFCLHVALAWH